MDLVNPFISGGAIMWKKRTQPLDERIEKREQSHGFEDVFFIKCTYDSSDCSENML